MKQNMDAFKNRYKAIRIELPVMTEAGAEIAVARLKKETANLIKDTSGLHGQSQIVCNYIPESGILPDDWINALKLEIYNAVVRELPLNLYTDKAEETLKERLKVKNEIGEHQCLVLKSEFLKNREVRDMLFEKLEKALSPLNIIKLSTDDEDSSIFLISETALNQYIYEFFSKKPDIG